MARDPMFVLTDVAPYADGPAGVHGVLGQARTALCELAAMSGLEPTPLATVLDLEPSAVAAGGVLALFTIGETRFSAEQRRVIVEGWREGRLGILGVHSATDACHGWPEYGTLLGGRFAGHPWTMAFRVDVVDRHHPSTEHLGAGWDWHDELYLFDGLAPEAHVLLRLSEDSPLDMSAPGARRPDGGFPLAWSIGDDQGRGAKTVGRTFYSALGHFPSAWETPTYLRHLAGGLAWLRHSAP